MILFLGFEFALTLAALVVVAFIDQLDGLPAPNPALWLLGVLVSRALMGALVPMVLGFVRQLTVAGLATVTAAFIVISLWFADDIHADALQVFASDRSVIGWVAFAAAAFAVLALGPLFLKNVSDIHEWDSLFSFSAVLDWIESRTSPYKVPFEYSSFWECRLAVPVLAQRAFGDAAGLIVVPQAEALLILALATYVLAYYLIGDEIISAVLAVHAACVYHYWAAPVGLPSLKNDIIYNAGVVVAVLGFVLAANRGPEALAMLCICAGVSFILVKYSAATLIPAIVAAFLLADLARLGLPGTLAHWQLLVLPILVAGVLSGHFYVKNLIRFGNPLYPVELKLLGLKLPGYAKISGTSIIDGLKTEATRARTWKMLFGRHQFGGSTFWPIGVVALVANVAVPLIVLGSLALFIYAPREISGPTVALWAVAASAAAGIVGYLGTYGSASSWPQPGDLFHLNRLHSSRYALGVITVAIVALVAAVLRLSSDILYGLVAVIVVDAGLRLIPAYVVCDIRLREWRWYFTKCAVAAVIFCGLGLTFPYLGFLLALVGLVAGICLLPRVAADNPVWWQRRQSGLMARIGEAPAMNVFLVSAVNGPGLTERVFRSHLFVAGTRYQHSVRSGPITALAHLERAGWRPQRVVCIRNPNSNEPFDPVRDQLVRDAADAGFVSQAMDDGFCVFEPRVETHEAFEEQAPVIDDMGNAKVIPSGASLLVSDGAIRAGLWAAPDHSSDRGLFVKTVESWLPLDEALLRDLCDAASLSSAYGDDGLNQGWQIYSDKGHLAKIEMSATGDAIFRITGTEGTKHLALIYWVRGQVGRTRPISLVARVRSIGNAVLNTHAFDFVPTGSGEIAQIQYVDRYTVMSAWSHLALCRVFEGSNHSNRLAIGATLTQAGEGIEFSSAAVLDLPVYHRGGERLVYKNLVKEHQ